MKSTILILVVLLLVQNLKAQTDSSSSDLGSETLWYLQKNTWLVGGMLIGIILIGFLYRLSKVGKRRSKKIITETYTVIKPTEKEKDAGF